MAERRCPVYTRVASTRYILEPTASASGPRSVQYSLHVKRSPINDLPEDRTHASSPVSDHRPGAPDHRDGTADGGSDLDEIVISQVYGGGGNANATYTHDFVELFNRGTSTVSLEGWSIQYTSAVGTGTFGSATNLITPLSGSLAPGQYLLVQESSNAAVGAPLPTPDVTDDSPILMAGNAGKVALVNTTTPLGCNGGSTPCLQAALATIVDLVGYGTGTSGANFYEGAGPAPTLSATLAAFRGSAGCADTDNNGADFTAATPAPRNSASALNVASRRRR